MSARTAVEVADRRRDLVQADLRAADPLGRAAAYLLATQHTSRPARVWSWVISTVRDGIGWAAARAAVADAVVSTGPPWPRPDRDDHHDAIGDATGLAGDLPVTLAAPPRWPSAEDRNAALVLDRVAEELARACAAFGPMASPHEGYAVIREELDELWAEVKANRPDRAAAEAVQVAAMGARFVLDLSGGI